MNGERIRDRVDRLAVYRLIRLAALHDRLRVEATLARIRAALGVGR